MIWTKTLGAKLMVLTLGDLDILKQLRGAGVSGRNVRELNIRVTLDRLAKGGYVVGRPIGRDSVQYRITQRGEDAIAEHDL
jgi:DNA-binding transcriptional regulator PaaX